MLTREMAQDWIDAMISGKFKHGTDAFKADRGGTICHCALGVLAEINNKPLTLDGLMMESPEAYEWMQDMMPKEGPLYYTKVFQANDAAASYGPAIELIKERYLQAIANPFSIPNEQDQEDGTHHSVGISSHGYRLMSTHLFAI